MEILAIMTVLTLAEDLKLFSDAFINLQEEPFLFYLYSVLLVIFCIKTNRKGFFNFVPTNPLCQQKGGGKHLNQFV